MNCKLAPISFLIVVVHEIIQKFVVFINTARYDDKFTISACAMESPAWHFFLRKLKKLNSQLIHVYYPYGIIDET